MKKPTDQQLSELYRQQANDTSPQSLDDKVLKLAAIKAQALKSNAEPNKPFWKQSHWMGLASACCVMVLSLSILVPMTQAPLYESPQYDAPVFEKKRTQVSATTGKSEVQQDIMRDADEPSLAASTFNGPSLQTERAVAMPAPAAIARAVPKKTAADERLSLTNQTKALAKSKSQQSRAQAMPAVGFQPEQAAVITESFASEALLEEESTMEADAALKEKYSGPLNDSLAAEVPLTSEQWVQLIEKLVADKKFEQARLRAKDFNRAHPNFQQPDSWKSWLEVEKPQVKTQTQKAVENN